MRPKKHSQKVDPDHLTCSQCRADTCELCVDGALSRVGSQPVCHCKRKDHSSRVKVHG